MFATIAVLLCARSDAIYLQLPRNHSSDHLQLVTARNESQTQARNPAPKPYPPIDPPNWTLDDFPAEAPVNLTSHKSLSAFATLGNGPLTTGETFLRLRRDIFSWTGRDLTVENSTGWFTHATWGFFWTMHAHTPLYHAQTGQQVAMLSKIFWAFHRIFEIATYEPVCPEQRPQEELGLNDAKLYPFARLTKWLGTLYDHWTLERFNCDGSLTQVWDISSRYWVSLLHHYNVTEISSGDTIGTIDQAFFFQMSPNYDAWIRSGEDLQLFTA